MDCEKFDSHAIDALYDELDELTHAAMKRHMDGCSRCASLFSGLRATREVGVLPLEEPSADLEDRILEAASAAARRTPWPKRALRALAWAGSHAMRPELTMAAVLVLVIGSSLFFLRAKPGTPTAAPVRVTERGMPAPDQEAQAAPPPAAVPAPLRQPVEASPAPAAAGPLASVAKAEPPPASSAAPGEASEEKRVDGLAKSKSAEAPADEGRARTEPTEADDALADARATKAQAGCGAAVAKLDEVGARYPATSAGAAAMWEAAGCYKAMGDGRRARELYLSLRSNAAYRERADKELAAYEAVANAAPAQAPVGGSGAAGVAAQARAAAAPAAPAKAAAPAKKAAASKPTSRASAPDAAPRATSAPAPAAEKKAVDSAY